MNVFMHVQFLALGATLLVAARIIKLSCWVAVASLAVPCGVLWCSDRIREILT